MVSIVHLKAVNLTWPMLVVESIVHFMNLNMGVNAMLQTVKSQMFKVHLPVNSTRGSGQGTLSLTGDKCWVDIEEL